MRPGGGQRLDNKIRIWVVVRPGGDQYSYFLILKTKLNLCLNVHFKLGYCFGYLNTISCEALGRGCEMTLKP